MNLTKTKVAWSERSKKYRYHSEEIHSSWNHWSKLLKDLIRYHDIWTKIPWKCISFMCKNSLWKMIKTLAEKIFRQINYLVNSLVESLFSRNVCQKSVIVNCESNFHCILRVTQRGKMKNLLSTNKYFVKSTI